MAQQPYFYTLLATGISIDMNTAGDTPIYINNADNYIVLGGGASGAFLVNGSTTTTSLVCNLWTGAGATGTKVAGFGTPANFNGASLYQSSGTINTVRTEQTLYFNIVTPNGAPLTGDIYIFGLILS